MIAAAKNIQRNQKNQKIFIVVSLCIIFALLIACANENIDKDDKDVFPAFESNDSVQLLDQDTPFSAGFRTLDKNKLKIGVWYPSRSEEKSGRLGPFDVVLAFDGAPVIEGHFQPVLISHGNSGRMRNHHLTAKALARAGFIAIAPLHLADHLVGGSKTYKAINWRTRELNDALEAVLQVEELRNIIDLTRVHAIGYSLGAITALNAAGAGIDGDLVEEHCAKNEDPAFCEKPSWFLRQRIKFLRGAVRPWLMPDVPDRYFSNPIISGGVAVIAPVGQGLVYDENVFRARKVFIVGFHNDYVTVPQFHAEHLAAIIPESHIGHFSIREGHHSAFIAPFAKRVTDREYIEAAQDPQGFDRVQFLNALNKELVSFFQEQSFE